MDNTARLIDLALAETLITQKKTYSQEEYQNYKYELLQCIIGESIIGKDDKQNFHFFTRSNRSRKNIVALGQEGLIIELIINAIKFDAYVYENTWCRLQTPVNLTIKSKNFTSSSVVPFIVSELNKGKRKELIDAIKNNRSLCEAAITSFVETRYERGLFNKGLDEICLKDKYKEHLKLIEEINDFKDTTTNYKKNR